MTNYYENNKHVLISGTLISPDQIQYVKNNRIVTQKLNFSKLYEKGKGSETAFYDVVVTGTRLKNEILVDEIIDSPEETGESVYRLGDHNIIKWAFVSENDFYDSIRNVDSVKKVISLLNKDRIANIDGIGRVKTINTTVDYFDHRYPHFFVCNNNNNKLTITGKKEYKILFNSFQLGVSDYYK